MALNVATLIALGTACCEIIARWLFFFAEVPFSVSCNLKFHPVDRICPHAVLEVLQMLLIGVEIESHFTVNVSSLKNIEVCKNNHTLEINCDNPVLFSYISKRKNRCERTVVQGKPRNCQH